MLKFKILGIPQAKQSARFRIQKMGDRNFIKSYQTKEVLDNERNIRFEIKSFLPEGFKPLTGEVGVRVRFVFPPLKSFPKKLQADIEQGKVVYKVSKPDLVDNLMKGLFDAMKGVVFIDDSQVCKTESIKVYGPIPCTEIELYQPAS